MSFPNSNILNDACMTCDSLSMHWEVVRQICLISYNIGRGKETYDVSIVKGKTKTKIKRISSRKIIEKGSRCWTVVVWNPSMNFSRLPSVKFEQFEPSFKENPDVDESRI